MYMAVVFTHVVLSLLLILIIIIQPGKGGDVGAAFGGGGSGANLFGPRGPQSLLQRGTTFVAVSFMFTSITLAWYSDKNILANGNVLDELDRVGAERANAAEDDGTPDLTDGEPDAPETTTPVPAEAEEAPAQDEGGDAEDAPTEE